MAVSNSFIANVNAVASKLSVVETANNTFDPSVLPLLNEIASIDLEVIVDDLKKGNYLGNRKIDINLALNVQGITADLIQQDPAAAEALWVQYGNGITYDSATITYTDGSIVELPFLSDNVPTVVSNTDGLLVQLSRSDQVTAVAQESSIYSFIVLDSTDYTVTIDSNPYVFTSGVGATKGDIITGLTNQINSGDSPWTAHAHVDDILVTADVAGNPFNITVGSNLGVTESVANVTAGTYPTDFSNKLTNTSFNSFTLDSISNSIRFYDNVGQNSNIEHIQLHTSPTANNYVSNSPIYYWAETTSALETLAMRAGDVIKIGNEIDNIILLAASITEVISVQDRLPELIDTYVDGVPQGDITIYNRLAELHDIYQQLSAITTVYADVKVGGTNYTNTVATNISDVGTVATSINNVNLTGGSVDNVNTVATNVSDVNTVASVSSDVSTVAADSVNINATGNSIANVDTVAGSIDNINNVAADISNVDIVGGAITSVDNVGNNIADVNTVSTSISDVSSTAGSITNVNTVAASITDVNTVSGSITNVNTVGNDIINIDSIATDVVPNMAEVLLADDNAAIATAQAAIATNQANIATTKADEIVALNGSQNALNLTSGSAPTAYYNSNTGLFTFGIPQGAKGDKGDSFEVNAVGPIANKSIYDDQQTNFSFLAIDESKIYFKLSSNNADWSVGSPFGKGDTGNGIDNITYTSSTGTAQAQAGETDTYTITYTDATTDLLVIKNGVIPTKVDIGLGNVDNTADADKPISNATSAALALKANINNPTFTGTVNGITKSMIGLSNVDNTTDADKPISTDTQNSLDTKFDKAGGTVNGNISITGTVDGRDISVDGTKLDGIEDGATADQTKADIDALGINASTVNSLTVETAVPSGAVFTDTQRGITDSISTTDSTISASATAVKAAYDLANNAGTKLQTNTTTTEYIDKTTAIHYKLYIDNGQIVLEEL